MHLFIVHPQMCSSMMVPSDLISSGATSACLLCFEGKPRGIRCARKLRVHRREALWADKDVTCIAVKRSKQI